jgi:protein TonB
VIPKTIAVVKDLNNRAPQPAGTGGVVGGVIGGLPGGQLGGVLGGILGGRTHIAPPPPPKAIVQHGPYRVGGEVQPPQLVRKIQPNYPPLARQTRTQGDVVINCMIDSQGNVTQMKLVSGPPLLVQAAMQAVGEWKYRPTLLNGTPVSVEMHVTVHFSLGS